MWLAKASHRAQRLGRRPSESTPQGMPGGGASASCGASAPALSHCVRTLRVSPFVLSRDDEDGTVDEAHGISWVQLPLTNKTHTPIISQTQHI